MRVLIVEHKEIFGGGQVAVLNLLHEWSKQRAAVRARIVCSPNAALAPRARALGIETEVYALGAIEKNNRMVWNLAQRVAPTARLLQTLRRARSEVVLANGAFSFLASVAAAKIARVPIVWFEHNTTLPNDVRVRRMIAWANEIVVVSRAIREQFCALAPNAQNKITVIYNGVDAERFRPNPESRRAYRRQLGMDESACVVGTASRLSPEKGVEFFVEMANRISKENAFVQYLIVGDGPERAALQTLASNPAIHFLGARDDIPALLNAFDIFVLPSLAEAFGIAAVEAMACALPVVASDVGGLREIVLENVTGLRVPPRDARALADAVKQLLREPEMRQQFGANGRARAREHFSIDRTAREMFAVLERAANGHR